MSATMGRNTAGRTGERGAALVMALFLITILTVLGTLVLNTSIVEIKMANNQKISSQAFYAAEAGLERALLKAMNDFTLEAPSPSWANATFAGADTVTTVTRTGQATNFDPAVRSLDQYLESNNVKTWTFANGGTTVGRAVYSVYSYTPSATEIWIMSYATQPDAVAAVEYHLKVDDMSPYNNAIYAGTGLSGTVQGNVSVHGSMYINGGLSLSGNTGVSNNYGPAGGTAGQTLGALPFSYPACSDLVAKVRVRGGNIELGGAAQVGEANDPDTLKETLAGIYVDGGSWTAGKTFADEYSTSVPSVPMPRLIDPLKNEYGSPVIDANYTGSDDAKALGMYTDLIAGTGPFAPGTGSLGPPAGYKSSTGKVISGNLSITNATNDFSYLDSLGNGITYTKASKSLSITGNVKINGNLTSTVGLTYTARGPFSSSSTGAQVPGSSDPEEAANLIVTGNVSFDGGFAPPAGSGYLQGGTSTNSLGIATPGNITITGNPGDLYAGMFYAGNQMNIAKQMKMLGTIICGSGNFTQVPDIYQIPALRNFLPKLMPGGQTILQFSTREWRRVY